jgi:hypothetical protein
MSGPLPALVPAFDMGKLQAKLRPSPYVMGSWFIIFKRKVVDCKELSLQIYIYSRLKCQRMNVN